jgi:hypothetical protein
MLNRLIYWFTWRYVAPFAICPDCHHLERAFWLPVGEHKRCIPF